MSRKYCKPVAGQKFTVDGVEYIVGGKVGDGAAGLVRKARRIRDEADFAIKFLAPDPKYIDESVFDDVAARFRREGRRAPQLSHPGLVAILAYEDNTGGARFSAGSPKNPFILMEMVKGTTLESYIRRDEQRQVERGDPKAFMLTPARLRIASQVAQALSYLHQKKLVHRDVKPANVFLPAGNATDAQPDAKLGDFGIMKWGDFQASVSSGTLTVTSQRGLGTLKYMSPEQAIAPKDVTVRSDIFSFGITLFELCTGQILASPHHVWETQNARLSRGTTVSRILAMGYQIREEATGIAELVLDMHLRGPSSRPPIDKVAGRLQWALSRFIDED
ncbi:MAG: serine/threonine protein kinase [Acidobacteria bacterium]|nr:serine/threonine protein kinase [Acidobacteriota bacterium]